MTLPLCKNFNLKVRLVEKAIKMQFGSTLYFVKTFSINYKVQNLIKCFLIKTVKILASMQQLRKNILKAGWSVDNGRKFIYIELKLLKRVPNYYYYKEWIDLSQTSLCMGRVSSVTSAILLSEIILT